MIESQVAVARERLSNSRRGRVSMAGEIVVRLLQQLHYEEDAKKDRRFH